MRFDFLVIGSLQLSCMMSLANLANPHRDADYEDQQQVLHGSMTWFYVFTSVFYHVSLC